MSLSADARPSRADLAPPVSETAFGIYVHWPFCAAKCPYCDFNSHVRHLAVDEPRFASAFSRELGRFAERTPRRTVTSIFLGGGTPSLLAPQTVAAILDAIAGLWTVAPDAEITLEANPSSVEAERFRGYRSAGVNRLSLGVQALNDRDLKALGRLHDAATAVAAIELARTTFPRLSFDLIHSRPGQTDADWVGELDQALTLAADHLSVYQLTIEPGTPFAGLHANGRLHLPEPDMLAAIHEATQDVCEAAGMPAYEISNHARPGAESRHNLTYWRYMDYVGVGPGAHGRITEAGGKRATRCESVPEDWLDLVEGQDTGVIEDVALKPAECADELLVMGMRLAEGIALDRYETLAGRPVDPQMVADLTDTGMIETTPAGMMRATRQGRMVLDTLLANLAA